MLPRLQQRFHEQMFSKAKHQQLLQSIHTELGSEVKFRIMEAPVFCSYQLRNQIAAAAIELVKQCATPWYKQKSASALRPEYTVPGESPHSMFSVVDFAVSMENGQYVPKLVELQGFPSLFGYQQVLSDWMHKVYDLGEGLSPLFTDLHRDEYLHLFHQAVVGTQSTENVALLELNPYEQKTLPDFLATQNFLGVAPTDIRSVQLRGSQLYHERDGAMVELKRIYNRAIVDELEDTGTVLPFHWNDSLNVEWAGHPNWYFRMSKYSLPFLQHGSVPLTQFLSDLQTIPDDLSRSVLKPLYAFAGKGVNVSPTREDIEAVPEDQRENWVLMEKIDYAECVSTPLGANKFEIRCMVIWLDDAAEPVPTINLVRSGRGAMMGARYNMDEWTGATIAFFGED